MPRMEQKVKEVENKITPKVIEDEIVQLSIYHEEVIQGIEFEGDETEGGDRKAWELLAFPKSATGIPLI
jgi:hypothetical protein